MRVCRSEVMMKLTWEAVSRQDTQQVKQHLTHKHTITRLLSLRLCAINCVFRINQIQC